MVSVIVRFVHPGGIFYLNILYVLFQLTISFLLTRFAQLMSSVGRAGCWRCSANGFELYYFCTSIQPRIGVQVCVCVYVGRELFISPRFPRIVHRFDQIVRESDRRLNKRKAWFLYLSRAYMLRAKLVSRSMRWRRWKSLGKKIPSNPIAGNPLLPCEK